MGTEKAANLLSSVWLDLVALVGRDLGEALIEMRRSEPGRAAALLSQVQPRAAAAERDLATAAEEDPGAAPFVSGLAHDFRAVAGFARWGALTDDRLDEATFTANLGAALSSFIFDARTFGEWLREHQPDVAVATLQAAIRLRPAAGGMGPAAGGSIAGR